MVVNDVGSQIVTKQQGPSGRASIAAKQPAETFIGRDLAEVRRSAVARCADAVVWSVKLPEPRS